MFESIDASPTDPRLAPSAGEAIEATPADPVCNCVVAPCDCATVPHTPAPWTTIPLPPVGTPVTPATPQTATPAAAPAASSLPFGLSPLAVLGIGAAALYLLSASGGKR